MLVETPSFRPTKDKYGDLVSIENTNPSICTLTWVINDICNNACSYCLPALYAGKNHHYDWQQAEAFIDEVRKRWSGMKLAITGGEPTMSPFLIDLCKKVNSFPHSGVWLTTNGVRTPRYYRELAPHCKHLLFSYHPETEDPDKFLDKVFAASEFTFVTVRVMMHAHKKYWDKAIKMIDKINAMPTLQPFYDLAKDRKPFEWEAVRVLEYNDINDPTTAQYSEEQELWFETAKKHELSSQIFVRDISSDIAAVFTEKEGDVVKGHYANEYMIAGKTNFNGWRCNAGLESLYAFADGNVYRANCLVGGVIGKIQDLENFKWPKKSIRCNVDLCHCTSDVYYTKRKIGK